MSTDPRFVAEFDVSRVSRAGLNLHDAAQRPVFDRPDGLREVLDAVAASLVALALSRRTQGWTVMPAQQSLADTLDAVERLVSST